MTSTLAWQHWTRYIASATQVYSETCS